MATIGCAAQADQRGQNMNIVILAGQAAASASRESCALGHEGGITIIGEETLPSISARRCPRPICWATWARTA